MSPRPTAPPRIGLPSPAPPPPHTHASLVLLLSHPNERTHNHTRSTFKSAKATKKGKNKYVAVLGVLLVGACGGGGCGVVGGRADARRTDPELTPNETPAVPPTHLPPAPSPSRIFPHPDAPVLLVRQGGLSARPRSLRVRRPGGRQGARERRGSARAPLSARGVASRGPRATTGGGTGR